MEQHVNGIHLGLKNLKCPDCDFCTGKLYLETFPFCGISYTNYLFLSAAYSTILAEHKRIVHGTQRFPCEYCNHVAKCKSLLISRNSSLSQSEIISYFQTKAT